MTVFTRIALAAGAVAAAIGPIVLSAQIVAPTSESPVFEAASIRPAADTGRIGGRGTPGRFSGFNLSLRRLIRQAYDIHDSQIIGGSDWIESQGFDINATTGDKPPDQMRFMMQTLLRDRFKLKFHIEKRELPIYALVVARSDGRLGSGLKKIPDGECPPPGAVVLHRPVGRLRVLLHRPSIPMRKRRAARQSSAPGDFWRTVCRSTCSRDRSAACRRSPPSIGSS